MEKIPTCGSPQTATKLISLIPGAEPLACVLLTSSILLILSIESFDWTGASG